MLFSCTMVIKRCFTSNICHLLVTSWLLFFYFVKFEYFLFDDSSLHRIKKHSVQKPQLRMRATEGISYHPWRLYLSKDFGILKRDLPPFRVTSAERPVLLLMGKLFGKSESFWWNEKAKRVNGEQGMNEENGPLWLVDWERNGMWL